MSPNEASGPGVGGQRWGEARGRGLGFLCPLVSPSFFQWERWEDRDRGGGGLSGTESRELATSLQWACGKLAIGLRCICTRRWEWA